MKKKVLFIVQLPPPFHGASAMNEYVVQSRLMSGAYNCSVLPLQFSTSISDIGNTNIKKLWLMVVFCFRLFAKLVRFRPHLVYYTIAPVGSAFYRDALFNCIIKCFSTKRLLHIHGKGIQDEAARSSFKRMCYRMVFRKSHIIVLAHSLESDISSIYTGKPFVLNNGLPKTSSSSNKSADGPLQFLYLSNLVRSKGINIFLECINRLNKKNIRFKAVIAGAAYDISNDEIEHYLKENSLTSITEFAGPVYGNKKEAILSNADILIFPTYYTNEAFPVVLLEAMQAGLAVVTTNNGAINEIVENGITGFVTPMKDIAAMEEKMEMLAGNPSLVREMGKKGKQKFEQLYTIDNIERRLYEIFKQVLS